MGRITGAEPHPEAEGLTVCQVDVGGRTRPVGDGRAQRAPRDAGARGPGGSALPGLGGPVAGATVRGVLSEGVLCSEGSSGSPTITPG